jgi:hypothetical protein
VWVVAGGRVAGVGVGVGVGEGEGVRAQDDGSSLRASRMSAAGCSSRARRGDECGDYCSM